jgi:N-dimethylarginine dimethylaminohydrolase
MFKINRSVLMSGAEYFGDADAINELMDSNIPVNLNQAIAEHNLIKQSLIDAGVNVIQVAAPPNCQDGVYTANWGLVRNGKAIMSRLPNTRQAEESYALKAVQGLNLQPMILPETINRFSGQGDSLACGNIIFVQSPYRTVEGAHRYVKDWLGFDELIALQTKPARRFKFGPAKINKITGLPDSPTYDIDLAIAILKYPEENQKGLIAYCPDVFKTNSRKILDNYDKVDKIKVSYKEAMTYYALNLVSTGETVVMNSGAPLFEAALHEHGLKTVSLDLPELRKGGGSIRCTTLSLDN